MQGVIGRHFERPWQGKMFYSFTLNGQDGSIGCGVKRPPPPGTSIKFNEKKNGKGYLEVDGAIQILEDGPAEPAPSASNIGTIARSASSGAGGGAAYWDRKEARDLANDANRELGASRNTAISIIDLALKNEVVALPAGKAKREEFFWALLEKYTNKLMGKDTSSEAVETVSKGAKEASPSKEEEPSNAEDEGWG